VPSFTVTKPTAGPDLRPIWGGALVAAVPATVRVTPAENDPDPLDYDLDLTLDVIAGRMQCIRLEIHQRPGGPPVTSDNIRRIPVGEMVAFATITGGLVRERIPVPGDPDAIVTPGRFEYPPESDITAAGGMTEKALEQAARIYRMASASGDRPYGVLERRYGLPRAKAARWIATARRRGILGDEDG
jgi:hypothetical protein